MQNFICTVPERLELVKKNTPKVAEVWGDYPFIVNYNHKENFEEIHSIYKEQFPKLDHFKSYKTNGELAKPRDIAIKILKIIDFPEDYTDVKLSVRDM